MSRAGIIEQKGWIMAAETKAHSTRTKIICTIGPSVSTLESIKRLIECGMNVARLNFSHGTHEEHKKAIQLLQQAREESRQPLAIMLDTKGPEIRTGKAPKDGIQVNPGTKLMLVRHDQPEAQPLCLSIRPDIVLDYLKVGTRLLIDNGYIQAKVVEISPEGALIEFFNSGTILSSKGVNIPAISVPLPALTEKDILDIEFGCKEGVDLIAASFIRNADNVLAIKKILHQFSRPDILVISKIESSEGVQNFDSILHVSDGIMVARGDLGVEVPLSEVPRLQKMMIRKCNMLGKPAVTATQMLESMIQNPRPTRAEVSDVANAIYDGTSSVMLSGETAVGKYPFDTVNIMKSIAQEAERDFDYHAFFDMHSKMTYSDVPSALTHACVKTAASLGAKAIFTFTHSGSTARLLSRLKPTMPIIALTPNKTTFHQLSLSWGVTPVLCTEPCTTMNDAFFLSSRHGIALGAVSQGDLVVLTAGLPMWTPGTSNTILVESIGDVLLRGDRGAGGKTHGAVTLMPSASPSTSYPKPLPGAIVVVSQFDAPTAAFVAESSGIILENDPEDTASIALLLETCAKEKKSCIIGVTNSFRVLQEGQTISIDPERSIVYQGIAQEPPNVLKYASL